MARFLINRKEITGKSPGTLIYLGKRKVEKPRIRLIHYDLDSEAEVELDTLQECLQWISDKSVSWLNIDGLHDPGLIQEMGDMFHIHGLQLEDIVNTDQRPKMDETDDLLIIYLKMVDFNQEERKLQSEQITLVLTRNILISLQESVGDYFDPVRERIRKVKGRMRTKGPDYLMYVLLDTIIENYLVNIEILGEMIEKTEPKIFQKHPDSVVKEIYKHKTEINFLRKSIRPAKEIIKSLLNTESTLIDEKNLKYFKDLDDLITQAIESVEVYQNMVNDQLNIYQTNVSNGLNEVMKVLTIFSAFFIPLTFIAGVYGMNFQYFPEIHLKYGYLYFWILMIIISVVLLVYFRRKKWF